MNVVLLADLQMTYMKMNTSKDITKNYNTENIKCILQVTQDYSDMSAKDSFVPTYCIVEMLTF